MNHLFNRSMEASVTLLGSVNKTTYILFPFNNIINDMTMNSNIPPTLQSHICPYIKMFVQYQLRLRLG
jgi:hypothetical protein